MTFPERGPGFRTLGFLAAMLSFSACDARTRTRPAGGASPSGAGLSAQSTPTPSQSLTTSSSSSSASGAAPESAISTGAGPTGAGSTGMISTGVLPLQAQATDSTSGVFTKYVFSFSLPPQATSAVGLSGGVSIDASGSTSLFQQLFGKVGFSEALFSVGYVPSGQCVPSGSQYTDYGTLFGAMPGATLLGTFIVKAYGSESQSVSAAVPFPAPLPIGGCVFVILDGMPPSQGSLAMTSSMSLEFSSIQGATAYELGPGDEFCAGMSSGCELSTTSQTATFASTVRIPQSGTILSLYGDLSEGATTSPQGPWSVAHEFYLDRGCTAFNPGGGFEVYGPGSYFSSIPTGSVPLLTTTLAGRGTDLQSMIFQPLGTYANAGDCIVHLVQVNGTGGVDAESQIHALILPGATVPSEPANPGYPAAPMYRFYDPTTAQHLFTASEAEGEATPGFTSEGIGFDFLSGIGMPGTVPIYRCFTGTGHFISTASDCEGFTSEGAYGSLYSSSVSGSAPLYRFLNPLNGDHLETLNLGEGLANSYQLEFVLGYAP